MVQYLKAAGLAFEVEDPSNVGHVFLVPLFLLNESQHSETEKLKLYKEEKLHAFGPMGARELTTRKFVVFGEGQVRS